MPKQLLAKTLKPQFRTFEIRGVNEENRTIELSFSSEEPYERYWGTEILDHSPTSVDLTRLNNAAPLLCNHDTEKQIGVVEKAVISSERKGLATVRFSRGEHGDEIFKDVIDGIRKNVSVGYRIEEMQLESKNGDDEVYRVTKWMPFEISIVSIPADNTIGVGRSSDEAEREVTITIEDDEEKEIKEEEKQMKDLETKKSEETPVVADVSQMLGERKRTSDILELSKRFGMDGNEAIKSGMSTDQFRAQVMDALELKQKENKVNTTPNADIGLSDNEKKQYSLMRALRDASMGKRDTFEFRVGEASAKASGIEARGLYIPADMLMRTMSVVDTGNGGNTVATNILGGSFIDALRAQSVIMQIATKLDGLVGNVQIPRQTGVSTVYKPAEKSAITQSDITTDFITLAPQRYGASVPVTKQLLMQSSLAVENMIKVDIAKQIALKIEADIITDILSQVTQIVALGTNGLAPTLASMISMETLVNSSNASMGNLKYVFNAKGKGTLKTTAKVSGYPSYIMENDVVNGYDALMSNLVPSNLVKGASGAVCSAAIFGNFDDVLIGTWGGLDIVMDIYTQAKEGIINITADQFADYDLRRIASFATIKDMLTV